MQLRSRVLQAVTQREAVAVAAVAATLVLAAPATAQCEYEVTSLDYPIDCGIFSVITIPTGLNNHGAVVGRYRCSIWTTSLGFLWTPEGGFVTLPLPPEADGLSAADINDAGAIVGSYSVPTGRIAFVYQDGQYTEILPPPGGSCNCIWASAIDNEGTVAGHFSIGNSSQWSAYVWRPETGLIDLGVMNGPYSSATDVSPLGVVGWTGGGASSGEGFLWLDGRLILIGPMPGGLTSSVHGIGPDRTVVGWGVVQPPGAEPRGIGFVMNRGGYHIIAPIDRYDTSSAGDINRFRQVTGLSGRIANPDDRRGYLWQHGTTYDLNALVPPGSPFIQKAGAINDRGQIIARSGGRAVLLTPVGRPLGDVDVDCNVGVTDFLWVLGEWGRPDSPADLNDDGNVDQLDLIVVIDNWGA